MMDKENQNNLWKETKERDIKDIDTLNTFIPYDNNKSIPKGLQIHPSSLCIWCQVWWKKKCKISCWRPPHNSRHIRYIIRCGINWTCEIDFVVGRSKWFRSDCSSYRKCKLKWIDKWKAIHKDWDWRKSCERQIFGDT